MDTAQKNKQLPTMHATLSRWAQWGLIGSRIRSVKDGFPQSYERTNIVCIELIHANKDSHSSGSECPGRDGSQDGEFALMQIVNHARVKLENEGQHAFSKRKTNWAHPDVTVHH